MASNTHVMGEGVSNEQGGVGLSGGLMAAGGHASQRYCCTSPGGSVSVVTVRAGGSTCESGEEGGHVGSTCTSGVRGERVEWERQRYCTHLACF